MIEALDGDAKDFGKEIIPSLVEDKDICCHIFDDYWEDIGTVKAFFDANLQLTEAVPSFNFYDEDHPIYNYPDILPTAKLTHCEMDRSTVASGCMVGRSSFTRCMLGVRSMVGDHCKFENVVMMGADYFDTTEELEIPPNLTEVPEIGVGDHSVIKDCIIDKNARIGSNVKLSPNGLEEGWADNLNGVYARDGILVVVKNAIVPDGTNIGQN